jgi:pimeloyl-ACP methyl ester carboxylesterase
MADVAPPWLRRAFGVAGTLSPRLAALAADELLTRPRGRNPPQPWELEPSEPPPEALRLPGGLHALAWGDAGPVVLAAHGWRGRPTQFRRLAEALAPAGLRLVALDAPGHGLSPGRRATPRLVADAMLEAAGSLGEVRAVVGHSMGGAAAAIALEFGLQAGRLVLLGAPSRPSLMISGFADRIGLPPRARAALDARFDAHAGRPVGQLDVLSLRLPAGVAALVVHDRDDDVIPVAEAQLLEVAWPEAQFLYTAGLGHRDVLADAAVVRAVTGFILDRRDGRRPLTPPLNP